MHIDILIDASGSMGFMKGQGEHHENKYLIDEKHTRTDLIKNILIDILIPSLNFADTISIESFLNRKRQNSVGKPIIKDNHYVEYPDLISQFSGKYDREELINSIQKIDNPEPGGTPLRWSLLYKVNNSNSSSQNIIVFSDGEGYWESKIDEDWPNSVLELIKSKGKNITFHFVGIAQNQDTQKRCKYICSQTNCTYTNLESIDYQPSQLDSLLFNLKSSIVSDAINNIDPANLSKYDNEEKNKTEQFQETTEQTNNKQIQTELELQVNRNTRSLELVTNQLDNIVRLLSSKMDVIDEVMVEENIELNLKTGRLAEEFLYNELSKNNWEISWLNKDGEKFMPYDFEIKINDNIYYYECKGTVANLNEFQLTKNEWLFYLKNRERYRLIIVNNVQSNPSYIQLLDLFEEMNNGKLIPCSGKNIKLKANRLFFSYIP